MSNGVRLQVVLHTENKYYLSRVRVDTSMLRDKVGLDTLLKITDNHQAILNKINWWEQGMAERVGSTSNTLGTIEMEFILGYVNHQVPVDVLGTEQGDFGVIIGRQTSYFMGLQTTHLPEVVDVSSSSSEE